MIIIISPSKTQNASHNKEENHPTIIFEDHTKRLWSILKSMSQVELGIALSIRGKLLEDTYHQYHFNDCSQGIKAIECYQGIAFEQIDTSIYTKEQLEYCNHHLHILSAMYGVLRPNTIILPYRLDMNSRIKGYNLYTYWRNPLKEYFEEEDLIINLASNEFSKMLGMHKNKMITVYFQEEQSKDILKTISYNAKMARGKMVHQMILRQVLRPEEMKEIQIDGYKFDPKLSNSSSYYFIKRMNII